MFHSQVHDKLTRTNEVGSRIWKHQLPLAELETKVDSGEETGPITFDMEMTLDKAQNCPNQSVHKMSNLWRKLRSKRDTVVRKSIPGERLEVDLQFRFYYDHS